MFCLVGGKQVSWDALQNGTLMKGHWWEHGSTKLPPARNTSHDDLDASVTSGMKAQAKLLKLCAPLPPS